MSIPEDVVYLDDKHPPPLRDTWTWVRTVDQFAAAFAEPVAAASLDYDLAGTDPGATGLDAVQFMADTGNWPTQLLALDSGLEDSREKMAAIVEASGLFERDDSHPLAELSRVYRRVRWPRTREPPHSPPTTSTGQPWAMVAAVDGVPRDRVRLRPPSVSSARMTGISLGADPTGGAGRPSRNQQWHAGL